MCPNPASGRSSWAFSCARRRWRLPSVVSALDRPAQLCMCVATETDDWKPEPPLAGEAARKAEQDAAAKLSAIKDENGGRKYLVISERLDPDSPEKRVTSHQLQRLQRSTRGARN